MSAHVLDEAIEAFIMSWSGGVIRRSEVREALEAAAPFIWAQGEREHRASALEDAASATDSTMEMIWLMDRAAAEREGGGWDA